MKRWYAVHTKPRQERLAEENLLRQRFEVYLPRLGESRRRRGKWVDVVESLFPRYLFVCVDTSVENISSVRSTRGVSDLVRFGDQLLPVQDRIIEGLKVREHPESHLHRLHGGLFEKGDRVKAVKGPFTDLEGIFLADKGKDRVLILMRLLGRDSPVALGRHDIAPASG
jgi:transcriptional antiterminator RfaH